MAESTPNLKSNTSLKDVTECGCKFFQEIECKQREKKALERIKKLQDQLDKLNVITSLKENLDSEGDVDEEAQFFTLLHLQNKIETMQKRQVLLLISLLQIDEFWNEYEKALGIGSQTYADEKNLNSKMRAQILNKVNKLILKNEQTYSSYVELEHELKEISLKLNMSHNKFNFKGKCLCQIIIKNLKDYIKIWGNNQLMDPITHYDTEIGVIENFQNKLLALDINSDINLAIPNDIECKIQSFNKIFNQICYSEVESIGFGKEYDNPAKCLLCGDFECTKMKSNNANAFNLGRAFCDTIKYRLKKCNENGNSTSNSSVLPTHSENTRRSHSSNPDIAFIDDDIHEIPPNNSSLINKDEFSDSLLSYSTFENILKSHSSSTEIINEHSLQLDTSVQEKHSLDDQSAEEIEQTQTAKISEDIRDGSTSELFHEKDNENVGDQNREEKSCGSLLASENELLSMREINPPLKMFQDKSTNTESSIDSESDCECMKYCLKVTECKYVKEHSCDCSMLFSIDESDENLHSDYSTHVEESSKRTLDGDVSSDVDMLSEITKSKDDNDLSRDEQSNDGEILSYRNVSKTNESLLKYSNQTDDHAIYSSVTSQDSLSKFSNTTPMEDSIFGLIAMKCLSHNMLQIKWMLLEYPDIVGYELNMNGKNVTTLRCPSLGLCFIKTPIVAGDLNISLNCCRIN